MRLKKIEGVTGAGAVLKPHLDLVPLCFGSPSGEIKVSTSTVAARFSKMALTGQRIAMVDMDLQVFPAFPYLPEGGWSQSFPLKIFFSCSLGGGGRYFSAPCP